VLVASSYWRLAKGVVAALVMAGAMLVARPLGFAVAAVVGLLAFAAAALVLRVPSSDEMALLREHTGSAWRRWVRREGR
jgi:hypothetical protein